MTGPQSTKDKAHELPPKTIDEQVFAGRKTPWNSIWMSVGIQFVFGLNMSIYYMSIWPYLTTLDKTATMTFFGWVVAAYSAGCSIANPLFGYWNERTLSTVNPTIVGLLIAVAGQLMYGLLPLLEDNQKWFMITARAVTGFGLGSLSVLRAYVATATLPKDRLAAISYTRCGWLMGVSIGPAIQACFTPVGKGFAVAGIRLDMYTLPAFLMVMVTLITCVLIKLFFKEEYVGIIHKNDTEARSLVEVPKYDLFPALICIYIYVVASTVVNHVDTITTPLTTAMYGWNDSKSILYNGIMESITCLISAFFNFLIAFTRIGQIDKRKQVIFGLTVFLVFYLCNFPWPFYSGPLEYIPIGNSSAEIGGCDREYTWCATAVRVPQTLYVFCFIVLFGLAFPFVISPSASLYSDILGPRKQGVMQGFHSLAGNVAQLISPILITYVYQESGYRYVVITQLCTLSIGAGLMLLNYNRLVPLKLRSKS